MTSGHKVKLRTVNTQNNTISNYFYIPVHRKRNIKLKNSKGNTLDKKKYFVLKS